jgi:uncharacterized protein
LKGSPEKVLHANRLPVDGLEQDIPPTSGLQTLLQQSVPKPLAFLCLAIAALSGAAYALHGRDPIVSPAPISTPAPIVDHQLADSLPQVDVQPTRPGQRVMDEAGFLSYRDDKEGFEGYLNGINTESGVDIRFIFVPIVRGDIASYARDEARKLGMGRDVNRRSMLFVYDVANQRLRVEVGPQLEGMFPDGFVGYLMREQTASLFAAGSRKLALKSTMNIVDQRLREAALGGTYNPKAVAYITDRTRLAAGAGATARVGGGTNVRSWGERITTDEARAHFGPQPTVADAFARYHEALHEGYFEPDLPLYTPESQPLLRALPMARPFADFILLSEHGQGYKIVERGDLAILFFTTTPLVSAHLFRRTPEGWQLDLAADVRDTREFVGGAYTWEMFLSGDDYSRTFSDLFADFGPNLRPDRPGHRGAGPRLLRPAEGDNRLLPMRTISEAPTARKLVAGADRNSLLLPVDDPTREEFSYPVQTIDRLAVRRLLTSRSYDQLDAVLSAYSDSVNNDYRLEYRLFDAYDSFDVPIRSLEPLLDEWVSEHPKSAPARMARGVYLSSLGWNARGAKESNETSRTQFQQMDAFFARATSDFYMGARLDSRSIVPYRGLMLIVMNEPDGAMERLLLDRGLKLQPYSFRLRNTYMSSLTPRWGGSYASMRRFAEESAPYAAKNPRIRALAGYEDWDRGRVFEQRKEYGRALDAYTRALGAGDLYIFRSERGEFYWRRDKFPEALEDLNRALVQSPQDPDALYERSKVMYYLGFHATGDARASLFTQAYDDIELSVALDPTDEYHQEHLAFVRENLRAYAPPAKQY